MALGRYEGYEYYLVRIESTMKRASTNTSTYSSKQGQLHRLAPSQPHGTNLTR